LSKKKMENKVIPFVPTVTDVNPAAAAAAQLQDLISCSCSSITRLNQYNN